MSKSDLKHLQKAVQEVSKSGSEKEKIQSLIKAFELFTKETERLGNAYEELKEEFKTVNLELQETNQNLGQKVIQLDSVTFYLQSLLANISQGIIFVDLNGIVTTYNKKAEEILGADHLDVLFNNFWAHFPDDIFGFSVRESLKKRVSPETAFSTIKTPSGTKKELEIHPSFILQKLEEKNIHPNLKESIESTQGLIILIHDISHIRHLQLLAARNERLKELGEMAARVAHEIRNPLGGIKGFASLLYRDLEGRKDLQEMAQYIIEGTDSLNRLVTNVLNYSRPVQANFIASDIVDLVRDVRQHVMADESLNPKIVIEVETSLDSLIIPVDAQLLKSAILNLVVNAIQALPAEGGKISLQIEQSKDLAILKVSDTGVGISTENLNKIFSPFFTTKIEGTGLGLAEVHKVIQAHNGGIEVTSEINKGTIFTIMLPMKTP